MTDQGAQLLARDHYDTIVVGSGFGGAVAGCRLAQAGVDVAVVERGRRWAPGSFPESLRRPGSGWLWAHRHGLYDVGPLTGVLSIRAAGWGGGSLVYANVAMRPAPEVFEEEWPAPYRRPMLDPYFDLAAHMLEVTPVGTLADGAPPPKTVRMLRAAERLSDARPLFHPNLAVRFADDPDHPGLNRHGVPQSTCTGCARCDIGCNFGAKNTLDLNYLAIAEREGAAVATLTEVTHLSTDPKGYRLHLHQHGDAELERRTVTAERVILAAGSLGSTKILLRSRRTLPGLPQALGSGYSANGDFLTFGDDTADLVAPGTGPTITTAYGLRTPRGDRLLVEDGGYSNEFSLLVPGARRALGHDAVLLAMGRDSADGRIRLSRRGRLRIEWSTAKNMPLYRAAERASADVVEALGGRATTPPWWRWLRRPVSVHHLGGCRMAEDGRTGVVDADGKVHGQRELYVLDGAVLPAATGANPSHTITAVAERCVETLIRRVTGDAGWRAPEWPDVRPADVPEDRAPVALLPDRPLGPGVRFRERLTGVLEQDGRRHRAELRLHLTADDLTAFLHDARHRMRLRGRVVIDGVTAPTGATVESGTLDLLGRTAPGRRTMAYRMRIQDADGRDRDLVGMKQVWRRPGVGLWRSTTRLSVHEETTPGLTGVVRLSAPAVLRGALSIHGIGPGGLPALRFLLFFAARLLQQFGPRSFRRSGARS